jgi:citrate lyase subunit beta/citryl-CoA lyase
MGRSLLFVPGDSDRKLARSENVGADILVLDLEDSVAREQKPAARIRVREFLDSRTTRPARLWVRINPIEDPMALADLVEVIRGRPDGIVQPKVRMPEDVILLGHYLDALEAQHGITRGATGIIPVATETPAAIFGLGGYSARIPRLHGLTWGAEDLSATVGATANRDAAGAWTDPYRLARSLCLFGASAAGIPAIDTIHADIRDPARLRAECDEARRDGFAGKGAIHPDQVPVINECFTPSDEEIAHARRVVDLFASNPGTSALALDGRMVDAPHLRLAESVLARASIRNEA